MHCYARVIYRIAKVLTRSGQRGRAISPNTRRKAPFPLKRDMSHPTDRRPQEPPAFAIACTHCGAKLRVRQSDLGKERACPRCKQIFAVPDATVAERVERVRNAKEEFALRCQLCRSTLYAHPRQLGQFIPCPDCHTMVKVIAPAPTPSKPVMEDSDDGYRLLDVDAKPGDVLGLEETSLIRVYCRTCNALMYARPEQIGKLIPCVDCGTAVVVRDAPRAKKTMVAAVDPRIELAPEVTRVDEQQSVDRILRLGAAYADRVIAERPKPPRRPFWDGIYRFPFYREIFPRWITIAVLFMVHVPFLQLLLESTSPFDLVLIALPSAIVIGVIMAIVIVTTATLLNSIFYLTADGYDHMLAWPQLDFFERIGNVVLLASATIFSTAPLAIMFLWTKSQLISACVQIAGMMILFPFVFLCMIEHGTPALPFSRLIWRSLRILPRQWLKFYLASIPGWILVTGWILLAVRYPNRWLYASVVFSVLFMWVLTFRLLGRLAYYLVHNLPAEIEEEDESD